MTHTLSDPKGGAFDASTQASDTVDLDTRCDALWIGTAGNVKVNTSLGDTATFVGVSAGSVLPIRCTRLWSTGTTAGSILGLYDV